MKNLYLILRKNSYKTSYTTTYDLLQRSALKRHINVIPIYANIFDFSKEIELNHADGLYNLCDDIQSQIIEKTLINEKVNTFYKSYLNCISKRGDVDDLTSSLMYKKNKLPMIKSILSLTNNKRLLKKYAHFLNGFPMIIKSLGGSHGVGVMKIDSLESLYSVADYLSQQNNTFILKEFIDYQEHARLIVLNKNVISSIEYKRIKNDFRSNVGSTLSVVNKKFSTAVEKIAVDAVDVLGYEFGGVDLLIDHHHKAWIAEVNFPCYFPRAQLCTHIDISGAMIDYLIEKSKRKIAAQ